MSEHALARLLREHSPLLLSGAMGTELQYRGVRTELPLWSASALISDPELVKQIHKDYINAGAQLISTNSFRTNVRTLRNAKGPHTARELTIAACELAHAARNESGRPSVLIGGSIAPVEDCYLPELVPTDAELEEEHDELAAYLAEGGVDFLFIETMNCIREAKAATKAAHTTGLPVIVSFVCSQSGDLLNGDLIEKAVAELSAFQPLAFLTNCRPAQDIETSVSKLLACSPVPVGVYANGTGRPDDEQGWIFEGENPIGEYLEHARGWLGRGVSIIGGCCGTNPDYTRALATLIETCR